VKDHEEKNWQPRTESAGGGKEGESKRKEEKVGFKRENQKVV